MGWAQHNEPKQLTGWNGACIRIPVRRSGTMARTGRRQRQAVTHPEQPVSSQPDKRTLTNQLPLLPLELHMAQESSYQTLQTSEAMKNTSIHSCFIILTFWRFEFCVPLLKNPILIGVALFLSKTSDASLCKLSAGSIFSTLAWKSSPEATKCADLEVHEPNRPA